MRINHSFLESSSIVTLGPEHPVQLLHDLSQLQPFFPLRLLLIKKTMALMTSNATTAMMINS